MQEIGVGASHVGNDHKTRGIERLDDGHFAIGHILARFVAD